SDRELQVFKLLAVGKTIQEIAEMLGISPRTVETHKSRIMDKMGLKNIAELVRTAIRLEIVKNY
nr:helix-turn-helix transcriptional regulator [bacterium]